MEAMSRITNILQTVYSGETDASKVKLGSYNETWSSEYYCTIIVTFHKMYAQLHNYHTDRREKIIINIMNLSNVWNGRIDII